jgi:uncharacterized membrane protein YhaH (DUF805 family)
MDKLLEFKKYIEFTGRATRSEYWGVYIISCLLAYVTLELALALADFVVRSPFTIILIGFMGWAVAVAIFCTGFIMAVWLCAATAVRRCNDIGINPWFSVTLLLPPPLGTIPFIVFGVLNTNRDNENGSTN